MLPKTQSKQFSFSFSSVFFFFTFYSFQRKNVIIRMEYFRVSLYLEEFIYSTPLPTLAFLAKETQQQLVPKSIMVRYCTCRLFLVSKP